MAHTCCVLIYYRTRAYIRVIYVLLVKLKKKNSELSSCFEYNLNVLETERSRLAAVPKSIVVLAGGHPTWFEVNLLTLNQKTSIYILARERPESGHPARISGDVFSDASPDKAYLNYVYCAR